MLDIVGVDGRHIQRQALAAERFKALKSAVGVVFGAVVTQPSAACLAR